MGFLCNFARLFDMLPEPGDNEVTFSVFKSSCYYQSYHSKIKAILLSAPPKDTTSAFASLSSSLTYLHT